MSGGKNARFHRKKRARARWSKDRQYALRCRERGWVTPPAVLEAHYRMLTGRRRDMPCGCGSCLPFEAEIAAEGFRPWFMTPTDVSRETDAPVP